MTPPIEWSPEARSDSRRLDKRAAMRIFEQLAEFAATGHGDAKELQGEFAGKRRLRVGDYRVIFSQTGEILQIHRVRRRSEAYR